MSEHILAGARILVVEDEYLLADDLCEALRNAGADVIGPAASVEDATALIGRGGKLDAAVLDINLRGEMVFPVADALRANGIPFAFATGYDESVLPDRFTAVPRIEKPFKGSKLAALLAPMLVSGSGYP